MVFYWERSRYILFKTPRCPNCRGKMHMARLPVVNTLEKSVLTKLAGYRSSFYVMYFRCPSCKKVASIRDCYYAEHPGKLEKERQKGRDPRLKDMFYAALHTRAMHKKLGIPFPEPTSEDTDKNWHPFMRRFLLLFSFLLPCMVGMCIFFAYGFLRFTGFIP